MKKILIIVALLGLLFLMISSVLEMPAVGSTDNPSYNDTVRYYLENAVEDTNAPNVVAAIIIDYRGFDTLSETVVLFTAITAALSVLSSSHDKNDVKKVEN